MKIENKTRLSIKLIKRLMKLADCKADNKKRLVIRYDKRFNKKHGCFITNGENLTIKLKEDGNPLTLGHELRHLAQFQRVGFERYNNLSDADAEGDAENFEAYLEKLGF